MPIVVHALIVVAVSTVMGSLVAAKLEKQLFHMLEGNADRHGKSLDSARASYLAGRQMIFPLAFVAGVVVTASIAVLSVFGSFVSLVGLATGLLLMIVGVVGRLVGFRKSAELLNRSTGS